MMTGFLPWNIRSLTGFTAIGICLVYLSLGVCPSTPTSLWQKEEFWLLKTFKSWNLSFSLSAIALYILAQFHVFGSFVIHSICLENPLPPFLHDSISIFCLYLPIKDLLNTHDKHRVRI